MIESVAVGRFHATQEVLEGRWSSPLVPEAGGVTGGVTGGMGAAGEDPPPQPLMHTATTARHTTRIHAALIVNTLNPAKCECKLSATADHANATIQP